MRLFVILALVILIAFGGWKGFMTWKDKQVENIQEIQEEGLDAKSMLDGAKTKLEQGKQAAESVKNAAGAVKDAGAALNQASDDIQEFTGAQE